MDKNVIIYSDNKSIIESIPDGTFDLILTDPPYSISRWSNFSKVNQEGDEGIKRKFGNFNMDFGNWDTQIDMDWYIEQFYRILRKGGTLIMFYDSWKLSEVYESSEKVKFKQPRIGLWVKTNAVPINTRSSYLSNSKEMFVSLVKGSKATFNSHYDNGIYTYPLCHGKERTSHPTQKPLSLINDLISKHSNEGDFIFDPFIGSGTVGVSALDLNRNYLGIEVNQDYIDICKNRGLIIKDDYMIYPI